MAMTNKERVAAWRKRLAKHGFKPRTYVVHNEDAERAKKYMDKLRRQRLKILNITGD